MLKLPSSTARISSEHLPPHAAYAHQSAHSASAVLTVACRLTNLNIERAHAVNAPVGAVQFPSMSQLRTLRAQNAWNVVDVLGTLTRSATALTRLEMPLCTPWLRFASPSGEGRDDWRRHFPLSLCDFVDCLPDLRALAVGDEMGSDDEHSVPAFEDDRDCCRWRDEALAYCARSRTLRAVRLPMLASNTETLLNACEREITVSSSAEL